MVTNVSEYRFKSVPPKQAAIAHVVWFHEENPRGPDQYGDSGHLITAGRLFFPNDKTLRRDIVEKFVTFGGWDGTQKIVVQKLLPEQVTEALRRLELEYERIKSEAPETADGMLTLQVFRHCWCDSKGKLIAPIWQGITCNRRGSQLLESLTQIVKINKGDLTCLETDLPMEHPDTKDMRFENEDHRIIVATRENTVKTEGFKPMSGFDILRMVYKLAVQGGRSTGWIERNLGVKGSDRVVYLGWAKFIQYCEIEMDWGLRLWDRLNPSNRFLRDEVGNIVMRNEEPVSNPEWIDLKKFNQMAWQGPTATEHPFCNVAMGAMTDLAKDLDAFNKDREKNGKPSVTRPAGKSGREYVVEWINHFNETGGKGVTKKIMTKDDINRLRGTSNKVGREFVKAIYDNDHNALIEVGKREFVYNHVHDVTDKVYARMEAAFKEVRSSELEEDEQLQVWDKVRESVKKVLAMRKAASPLVKEDSKEEIVS